MVSTSSFVPISARKRSINYAKRRKFPPTLNNIVAITKNINYLRLKPFKFFKTLSIFIFSNSTLSVLVSSLANKISFISIEC